MDAVFLSITIWHWLALAVLLLIVEMLTGSGFLLCIALASGIVAIIMAIKPDFYWAYQLSVFSFISLGSCILWWMHLKSRGGTYTNQAEGLNKRGHQYIGRIFTLEEPIENRRGKIRVDDTIWRIEGDDMPSGSKVKVIDLNGIILVVEKVE